MDPSQMNPFAVLAFIVAPAILTSASSVMALAAMTQPGRLATKSTKNTKRKQRPESSDHHGKSQLPVGEHYSLNF